MPEPTEAEKVEIIAREFDRRAERITELTDQNERLREIADAAAELIAAEDEMIQRDREYEELDDRDSDFPTRTACLDRAIEGRHAYADAREGLVALIEERPVDA